MLTNKYGSKILITRYNGNKDIDVYFPEYNWTFEHALYRNFKSGNIKCPYEPRTFNVGYLGEGKYNLKFNGVLTKCYTTWSSMLRRCYYIDYQKNKPTYIDCEVCEEWHNFQNFAKWYYSNYYEVEGQVMHLDKDILYKGNKMYSPDTCVFVPHNINSLFAKRQNNRGDYPIGVCIRGNKNSFSVKISKYGNDQHFYGYKTEIEAFNFYKQEKEKHIKKVANEYKQFIPNILYQALYSYEVEITD